MATLTQTPDSLSLSRNIKDVIISSSSEVRFRLKKGTTVLLDENYQPDTSGQITIDIRDVVTSSLSIAIPTSDSYEQTGAVGTFEIYLDSSSSAAASFTAVLGGVSGGATASTFLPANFLTWQAQEKDVTADQPEWLTYYFAGAYSVKAKFYNKDGTDKTVTLMTGAAGKVYSVNCQFSHLWALGATTVDGTEKERYGFIDVWVENSGTRLTYVQRYCFRRSEALDEVYLCRNSIGGIDTFLFTGEKKLIPEMEHTVGSYDNALKATNTDTKRRYSQNTGILKAENSGNLWDFFRSLHAYYLKDGTVTPVVLDSSTIEYSGIETANSWYFEYRLSDDDGLLKVQRSVNFPAVIEIPGPDQGTYYLAPRVVDYPSATLDSSLLMLLQSPYSQSWMRASLADLLTFFNPVRRLTQLADVLLTNPSDGQVLKYADGQWVNGTDSGGDGLFEIDGQDVKPRDSRNIKTPSCITIGSFKIEEESVEVSGTTTKQLKISRTDSSEIGANVYTTGGISAYGQGSGGGGGGGVSNLYQLSDVPDYRTDYRGKLLKSKSDGSGMEWVDVPTSAVWGNITGTLSSQTDLVNALAGKAASSHTHAISDITNLQTTLEGKQDTISDIATIRSNAANGATAYSDLTTVSSALISLQSQVDSIGGRFSGDELALAVLSAEVITGNWYGAPIATAYIADLAITASKIDSGAVITTKIADSAVTTAKVADSAITTAKIADLAVTEGKIAANAITTAKIADGNVTLAKLAQSVQDIINLFEREGSGTTADPYVIKAKYSLYSTGGLSAYGSGSGGGGSQGNYTYWMTDPTTSGATQATLRAVLTGGTTTKDGAVSLVGHTHTKSQISDFPTNVSAFTNDAGYITGITSSMVTTALGYTPFNAANFTKANIKSTLEISDWALASSKPSYTTSEVSEGSNLYFTDARALSALSDNLTTISSALTSLQSQVDSVASRSHFDELGAAVLSSELLVASYAYIGTVEGSLIGNATTATNATYATYDTASQNIANNFTTISSALQSVQAQLDSIGARFGDELTLSSLYADTVGASIGVFDRGVNMAISSGSVGIGITSPAQKLDVVGKLRLRYNSSTYVDIEVDASGNLKINGNLYTTGGVTAYQ